MKYFQGVVHSILLCTVPTVALYPQVDVSGTSTQPDTAQEPLTDAYLSYDDVINLINELESGELEKKYSVSDLERLSCLFAYLAREGLLPNEVEEGYILEQDIEDLLAPEDSSYTYAFALTQGSDYLLIPTFFDGYGEVFLCKTWIHKKWDQVKKFVKKHKKAIIIGTAVVVGAAIIVGAVALTTASAAGAGALAAKSLKERQDPKAKEEKEKIGYRAYGFSELMESHRGRFLQTAEDPAVQAAVEEEIDSFKENIAKEQFFETSCRLRWKITAEC